MKKHYVSTILLLFAPIQLFAQHAADKWYFGNKAGIDFTSGTATAINTSEMAAGEGSASISDPVTGALLFYTDGINVWNSSNTIMPNGTGLLGGLSSTQAALIVPVPENSDQYYIFTTDQIGGTEGLRYSIVDMSLDGGNGNVTTKNILLHTPVAEKITAVQDHGTPNYWLVSHGFGNNSFYAFKITASEIEEAVVSNVGIVHSDDIIQNSYGQLKFNPCGDKLALAAGYLDKVELFDFNIITGEVTNAQTLSYSDHVFGVEFSQNGDVLYVSTYEENATLMQYDLTAADLPTMLSTAQIVSTSADIYPLQRGPDGKIYVCRSFSQYVGVIHQPDNFGSVACNYIEMGLDLDPGFLGLNSGIGLPNFVTSYMGGTANCIGSTASVDENNAELNTVYPNPSGSDFTFVAKQHITSVSIHDLSGKILESHEQILPGSTFHFGQPYVPGMYFVRALNDKGNSHTLKVLKTD